MTRETIRRIPELNNKILRDKAHLRYLREKATAVPALSVNERVQTSKKNDRMKYSDAAVDLEAEIKQKMNELESLQKEAKEWIGTLDTAFERRIFLMRLYRCLTWEEIAELTGYSSRRILQIAADVIQNNTE